MQALLSAQPNDEEGTEPGLERPKYSRSPSLIFLLNAASRESGLNIRRAALGYITAVAPLCRCPRGFDPSRRTCRLTVRVIYYCQLFTAWRT